MYQRVSQKRRRHIPVRHFRPLLRQVMQKQNGESGLPDAWGSREHHSEGVAEGLELFQHQEVACPDHDALAQALWQNPQWIGWDLDKAAGNVDFGDRLSIVLKCLELHWNLGFGGKKTSMDEQFPSDADSTT